MDLRNYLYDKQIKKVFQPKQCTISVGNITVGGTGKTPMIEFLVSCLLKEHPEPGPTPTFPQTVATLSRGYGRQSKGFRLAKPDDTAQTIGDEPLQLYRKFGHQITVAVAERRAEGLQQLDRLCPAVRVVLLDDAFQHRAVKPHLNLLLTDLGRLFTRDHPFPEGRLRESREGARRADAILVTKCPEELSLADRQLVIDELTPYKDTSTPIFFTGLTYGSPKHFNNQPVELPVNTPVMLVSGLANADPLEAYVRQGFDLRAHQRFADHYAYTRETLDQLLKKRPEGAAILTTEKDWVKLDPLLTTEERHTLPLFYLPITVRFLADEALFTTLVRRVAFPKNA